MWGKSFSVEAFKTPRSILAEQAALVSSATNGELAGEVRDAAAGQNGFVYSLSLVAPALGNYRYEILTIAHRIELYPVRVVAPEVATNGTNGQSVSDEGHFIILISKVLQSPRVAKVVASLISQIRGMVTPPNK